MQAERPNANAAIRHRAIRVNTLSLGLSTGSKRQRQRIHRTLSLDESSVGLENLLAEPVRGDVVGVPRLRNPAPSSGVSPANLTSSIVVGSPRCDGVLTPIDPSTSIKHGLLDDPHLHDRGFWKEVEHPELGRSFVYPGEAASYNGSPWRISRRAPLIGEHNTEIFCDELGLSRSELSVLAESRVI